MDLVDEVGLVTLTAYFDPKKDIDINKINKIVDSKINIKAEEFSQKHLNYLLSHIVSKVNNIDIPTVYILTILPEFLDGTYKLAYLPPYPWDKNESNEELFNITEEEVKTAMKKVLINISNLSEEEIENRINYDNI